MIFPSEKQTNTLISLNFLNPREVTSIYFLLKAISWNKFSLSVLEKFVEKSKENVDTDVRVKRVKKILADRLRSSFCIINV